MVLDFFLKIGKTGILVRSQIVYQQIYRRYIIYVCKFRLFFFFLFIEFFGFLL